MSVPKYKRNVSKIEFIETFNKLRTECIMLLCRDFGIKARNYSIKLLEQIYDIPEEDRLVMEEILERNAVISTELDKYPNWLVDGWRNEIMAILNCIGIEIYAANSIFPQNLQEYYNRRMHWNNAIGYCMALMDKLQEVLNFVSGIKVGAFRCIFELLNSEIRLLKAVRKSDNRFGESFANELPLFYNAFVYNNYPLQPFAPNYCANNNTVGPEMRTRVMRNEVDTNNGRPMCVIVQKPNGQSAKAA